MGSLEIEDALVSGLKLVSSFSLFLSSLRDLEIEDALVSGLKLPFPPRILSLSGMS
jgi:hypothetical protein